MMEPERLLEQTTSALERALLQEGRAYHVPDRVHARTLSALGLTASVGLGAALLMWWSARSWAAKIVLGLSTVTLVAGIPVGYVLLTRDAPAPQPIAPPTHARPAPIPVAPPAPPLAAAAPAPAVDTPATPPAPARPAGPASSALRAEVAALDAVRSTLANDDPAGALSFLAAYFRTFPRGRLRYEAEVLRIDAWAKAGRPDAAKRHAQEFLKRHPNSVLAARVRPYAEP
jgi:hypothetical protein